MAQDFKDLMFKIKDGEITTSFIEYAETQTELNAKDIKKVLNANKNYLTTCTKTVMQELKDTGKDIVVTAKGAYGTDKFTGVMEKTFTPGGKDITVPYYVAVSAKGAKPSKKAVVDFRKDLLG